MSYSRSLPAAAGLTLAVLLSAGCVVSIGDAAPVAETAERSLEERVRVAPGDRLRIHNLAGHVRLMPTSGDEVTIRADVVAGGGDVEEATALAERIALSLGSEEGDAAMVVEYPVDDYSRFHYRGEQDSGFASWFGGSNSRIEYQGERVSVSTTRRSGAATVHANLEIGVPAGVEIRLLNAVGQAEARDIDGALTLIVYSGAIRSSGGQGSLSADTGSGSVEIEDRGGDVLVDTGSGSVKVRHTVGEVRVDTGSGGVTIEDVEGRFVGVDTGSGSVTLRRVSASLDVDTGSGSVSGEELTAGERVRVDTGSGRIRLAGDFSAMRGGALDTGSGSVTLRMSEWPSMTLDLRTSSGGVDVDLPDVRATRSDRDSFRGEVGEDPVCELTISTSSGGIRVGRD